MVQKPQKISGFPEWLPEQRLLEEDIVSQIREIYELHGFVPIETPAVELLSTLKSKGEIAQEIYVLRRLHGEEQEVTDSTLALHFDLTIPFARYVAQHFNSLVFPFKRYQLQKVWRGERPQEGRFREFCQFDIDIIARDSLPLCHDAEVITVVAKVFEKLKLGDHRIKLNNRKLLLGSYEALGVEPDQREQVIVAVDKIDKIGEEGVLKEIEQGCSVPSKIAQRIVDLARLKADTPLSLQAQIGLSGQLIEEGIGELTSVLDLIPEIHRKSIELDLSLARGLDYYTGSIIEVRFEDHPEFGSVCGGGRYGDLASRFIKQRLPGVGVSIGLTRLMALIFAKGLRPAVTKTTAELLVTVFDESTRSRCIELAEQARSHGIACDVYHTAAKLGRQIEYGSKKGIRFALFVPPEDPQAIEIKDLETGEQQRVDFSAWCRARGARHD